MLRARAIGPLVLAPSLLLGCGEGESGAADAGADGGGDELLSATGLFDDVAGQDPREGVIAYDVIAPLWADGADKIRFLAPPPGGAIDYTDDDAWGFPDGTTLVKTFAFPLDLRDPGAGRRLVETRLFSREDGAWTPRVYVWNDDQTDAVRRDVGGIVEVAWIDENGADRSLDYVVPNANDCYRCHTRDDVAVPLGPKTLQLDRDGEGGGNQPENQIDAFAAAGLFSGDVTPAPDRERFPDPLGDADVAPRARAWLDASCAHCHRTGGASGSTGMHLAWDTPEGTELGICKIPDSAGAAAGGLPYDIVPGHPEMSIMLFRLGSTDPEVRMPELPTVTIDQTGVGIVTQWIAAMEPIPCE